MKWLLIIPALAGPIVGAEDSPSETMRERLHARLMASLPPAASAKPTEKPMTDVPPFLSRLPDVSDLVGLRQDQSRNDRPIVVLAPVVVSELKRDRNLEAAIARQTERQPFSPTSGGTIYSNGRLKAGGWWTPTEGWSFLKVVW